MTTIASPPRRNQPSRAARSKKAEGKEPAPAPVKISQPKSKAPKMVKKPRSQSKQRSPKSQRKQQNPRSPRSQQRSQRPQSQKPIPVRRSRRRLLARRLLARLSSKAPGKKMPEKKPPRQKSPDKKAHSGRMTMPIGSYTDLEGGTIICY